jgi:hypothetical protein
LETPNVVGGRYELLEQIGGSSWRAADTELEREVLVRMPAAGVGGARLSHPSIVQVFDQGEHAGESYAVFEYAGGGTLADRDRCGHGTKGRRGRDRGACVCARTRRDARIARPGAGSLRC